MQCVVDRNVRGVRVATRVDMGVDAVGGADVAVERDADASGVRLRWNFDGVERVLRLVSETGPGTSKG